MYATKIGYDKTSKTEIHSKAIVLMELSQEERLETELKLLSEINNKPDPCLSAEQFLCNALEHIRVYYKADACLVVLKMPDDSYVIFKAARKSVRPMQRGHALDESIAVHLLAMPPHWSIYYAGEMEYHIPSPDTNDSIESLLAGKSSFGEAISNLLEVDSFASSTLCLQGRDVGRLYLTNCSQSFDAADMHFLQQLANEITPQIDNISLQNKAAADATLVMRQKISIDLHDSTIQPYIGLKLGLEALRRKIPQGEGIAAEVDELVNMATESITELRQYIDGLKSQIKSQLGTPLVPAILEVAKKYQHRHGIEVTVNIDPALKVSECLANEIYQLVCEGLSNVLRHTTAKQATVNLRSLEDQLIVEVVNHDDSTQDFIYFKPRSMTERVTYLGGTLSVNRTTGDKIAGSKTARSKTIVTAEIPLQFKDKHDASFA
jgi:signal transduction histidine kinase